MQINGHVAVVTGGASGLGSACVQTLLKQGAQVVVWDKTINRPRVTDHTDPANKPQDSNVKANQVHFYTCDVADEASVKKALAKTILAYGAPRILIQCAGVLGAGRMVSKSGAMPLDVFQKVININLVGTFNVMRLVSESMISLPVIEGSEERGTIINTASIAAFEGQIGQVAYSASKGGVVSMTLPVARELAKQQIRVNTIAPGLMETPMLANMTDELQSRLQASFVFPERLGQGSEFAALVCHIIENSLINGEVIRLDGGIRLQAR